jgi:hypothetical protein
MNEWPTSVFDVRDEGDLDYAVPAVNVASDTEIEDTTEGISN